MSYLALRTQEQASLDELANAIATPEEGAYFYPYIQLPDIPRRLKDGYYKPYKIPEFRNDCIYIAEFLIPGQGLSVTNLLWGTFEHDYASVAEKLETFYEAFSENIANNFGVSLQQFDKPLKP